MKRALALLALTAAAIAILRASKTLADSFDDYAEGDWPFLNPLFHNRKD